jgi:hypothetical protein
MKRVIGAVFVALASLGAAQAPPQDATHFVGRWMLLTSTDDTRIAEELTVTWTHGSLIVVRQFMDGSRSETSHSINSYHGPIMRPGISPSDARRFSGVRWQGDSLVFENGRVSETGALTDESVEHREIWSINSSSMLVITVVERQTSGGARTTEGTYLKQWTVPPRRPATA